MTVLCGRYDIARGITFKPADRSIGWRADTGDHVVRSRRIFLKNFSAGFFSESFEAECKIVGFRRARVITNRCSAPDVIGVTLGCAAWLHNRKLAEFNTREP
jgi:hypothetical protein